MNAAKDRLLEDGASDASFLVASGEGATIPADIVAALDLEIVNGKVKQRGAKAAPDPAAPSAPAKAPPAKPAKRSAAKSAKSAKRKRSKGK